MLNALVSREIQITTKIRYNSTSLEWLKLKKLVIPNISKVTELINFDRLLSGTQNASTTLENRLAISYKIKYTLSI